MKKITIVLLALLVIGIVAAGIAAAYGMNYGKKENLTQKNQVNHEEMENIMENGTYQDLVDYREKAGFNIKPWVQSEEDFAAAKERHEQNEASGYAGRQGTCGRSSGGCGNCPMRQNNN